MGFDEGIIFRRLIEFFLADGKREKLASFLSTFVAHGLPAVFDFDIVGLAVVTFGTRRKKERKRM